MTSWEGKSVTCCLILQAEEQEDVPDESILEHGQDQSPEETEFLRKRRKESKAKENKDIQTVKDVMKDVIRSQEKAGGANKNAQQALQAISDSVQSLKQTSDGDKAEAEVWMAEIKEETVAESESKQTVSTESGATGLSKEKAAQEYVDAIEQAKSASTSQSKTGEAFSDASPSNLATQHARILT